MHGFTRFVDGNGKWVWYMEHSYNRWAAKSLVDAADLGLNPGTCISGFVWLFFFAPCPLLSAQFDQRLQRRSSMLRVRFPAHACLESDFFFMPLVLFGLFSQSVFVFAGFQQVATLCDIRCPRNHWIGIRFGIGKNNINLAWQTEARRNSGFPYVSSQVYGI
jgi:hypothetical protein